RPRPREPALRGPQEEGGAADEAARDARPGEGVMGERVASADGVLRVLDAAGDGEVGGAVQAAERRADRQERRRDPVEALDGRVISRLQQGGPREDRDLAPARGL